MLAYTIDDSIESPLQTSVEVTIQLPSGPRWLFFTTPQLLHDVGDFVDEGGTRIHLGELHMIVVSEINADVIDSVLRSLETAGELERRTLPLSFEPVVA